MIFFRRAGANPAGMGCPPSFIAWDGGGRCRGSGKLLAAPAAILRITSFYAINA